MFSGNNQICDLVDWELKILLNHGVKISSFNSFRAKLSKQF